MNSNNWRKVWGSALLLSVSSIPGWAQQKPDTTIKSTTIEIIQSYKPEVKQAAKPVYTPELPKKSAPVPAQQYNVPEYPLTYTYPTQPLIPLKMPGDSVAQLPFANYVKAGLGNLKTYLVDVGIGSLQGANYQSNFHFRHLSQNGNALRQQKIAKTGLFVGGKLFTPSKVWDADLDVFRQQYYYYGYNQVLDTLPANSIMQTYLGMAVGMEMKNRPADELQWHYGIGAKFKAISNSDKSAERGIHIFLPASKQIDAGLDFIARAEVQLTTLKHYFTQTNNLLSFGGGIQSLQESFSGKLFLGAAIGQKNKWYFLPDIHFKYHPVNSFFSVDAGVKSTVAQNSFQELVQQNPYVIDSLNSQQSRTTQYYVSLGTSLLEHIHLYGKVAFVDHRMLPMFVNNGSEPHKFSLVYDSLVKGFHINLATRYQFAEKFQLGLSNDIYTFTQKSFKKVWHQPAFILKADMSFKPSAALRIHAYASILNQIFAPDASVVSGYAKLPGVLDIGAGAEYALVKRVHLFADVHNITNRKNERWLGYQQYGINIIGGVRVRF